MAPEFGQLFLISALAASLMQFLLGLNIIPLNQANRELLITRFTSIHSLAAVSYTHLTLPTILLV